MAEPISVEARPGVTPPPEAPAPAAEGGVDLPEELIQIPAVQGLVSGAPGAFSALLTDFEKLPEARIIAANKDSLMKAGMGFYRSIEGTQGVVFNQLFLSGDDVRAADQGGTLLEIAPPFAEINASIAASGAANPALVEGERPTGFKSSSPAPASAPPAVAAPSRSGLPAGAQKTLASKRAANMQLGAPTSGPVPGEGRLLASILKSVI